MEQRPVKQVIVMRTDLRMRKGKMIAQGAHASLKVFLDRAQLCFMPEDIGHPDRIRKQLVYDKTGPWHTWIEGQFTKICLQVNNEQELVDLMDLAGQAGIPCSMIIDSGKTEFHNVPTRTCIAIGPWWSDEIDKITGHLELL